VGCATDDVTRVIDGWKVFKSERSAKEQWKVYEKMETVSIWVLGAMLASYFSRN
jgi:hypothetical protein